MFVEAMPLKVYCVRQVAEVPMLAIILLGDYDAGRGVDRPWRQNSKRSLMLGVTL